MTRRFAVCLVLCLVGGPTGARAISTGTGDAMCCKSHKHSFCLTVPGRWRKVTQQQMDMLRASVDPGDDEYDFECVAAYGQDFVMGNPTSLIGVIVGLILSGPLLYNGQISRLKDRIDELEGGRPAEP